VEVHSVAEIQTVRLSLLDCRFVGRAELSEQHVQDLAADLLLRECELPPLQAVQCGQILFLTDGWHRLSALMRAGRKSARCLIRAGDENAARLASASANQGHGLRRSDADKRRAVLLALEAEPGWSDDAVANHCGVSARLVRRMRGDPADPPNCEPTSDAGKPDASPAPARRKNVPDVDRETLVSELERLFSRADRRSRLLGKTTEETLALHRAGNLRELAWLPQREKENA
jgi:hypothetical protein